MQQPPKPHKATLPDQLFTRQDESNDEQFYQVPRLVAHIDDATMAALTEFYQTFIPHGADIVDLMSSWLSHLPSGPYGRVAGLGMNLEELKQNPQLTEYCVHNLNTTPSLPYAENSFERAMIVVSIQYLTSPVAVLKDLRRTLTNQGEVCIAMSHRLFPTKAIAAFHGLNPEQRIALVQQYFELAGYSSSKFIDASPGQGADPLWLVVAGV